MVLTGLALVALIALIGMIRWGTRWGSTPEERACPMVGDAYLEGGAASRVEMTRAVSLRAPPGSVWPWLAQLGRGAGWYSFDWLDNGGKASAKHIVSWIPQPQPGDASAIGYLRHIEPGRALVWWVKGTRFVGATARLVVEIRLHPAKGGSRLVTRSSADAAGLTAWIALLIFRVVDSIMAIRQLTGIRRRVELDRISDSTPPDGPETGDRDQYQLYEVIYASGHTAGVPGKESAATWRQAALEDGILETQALPR